MKTKVRRTSAKGEGREKGQGTAGEGQRTVRGGKTKERWEREQEGTQCAGERGGVCSSVTEVDANLSGSADDRSPSNARSLRAFWRPLPCSYRNVSYGGVDQRSPV